MTFFVVHTIFHTIFKWPTTSGFGTLIWTPLYDFEWNSQQIVTKSAVVNMSIFKSFLTLCKYHLFDSWKQFYFSLIILSAFVGLIYSYRLIDILRRDRPLRFLSWALLAISIAIQPVAIYFVAKTIQGNHPDQASRKQVGNYAAKEDFAPIFYALCG